MHMLHGFCSIPKVYFVFEICVPELIDRIVMVLAKLERFKIANVKITRKDPELKPDIIDIQAVTDSDTSDTGSELSNEENDENGNGLGYQIVARFSIMVPRS